MNTTTIFDADLLYDLFDLLDLDISAKGEGLEVGSDGQGIVRGSDVGGEHHAVGVGVALVAHCESNGMGWGG